jgi:hypothetical protein
MASQTESRSRRDLRSTKPHLASAAKRAIADARAERIAPFVEQLRSQGLLSATRIARGLNDLKVLTPAGKLWTATQVGRLLRRLAAMKSPALPR